MQIFPEPKTEWVLRSMLSHSNWLRAKTEDANVSALLLCYIYLKDVLQMTAIFLGNGASR